MVKKFLIGFAVAGVLGFGFYRLWMYPRYTVPILMYHYLGSHEGTLSVTPESFERQMKYLRDHRYHVISLDEFIETKRRGGEFSHNTVVITFDDGQRNNYHDAFPILKKYAMPATIFVITQWTGQSAYLTWDQMREMSAAGVDFGSHTQHHVYLPDADTSTIWAEVVGVQGGFGAGVGKAGTSFLLPVGGIYSGGQTYCSRGRILVCCHD